MIIRLKTSDYSLLRDKLINIAKRTYKFQLKEPPYFKKLHGYVKKIESREKDEKDESTNNPLNQTTTTSINNESLVNIDPSFRNLENYSLLSLKNPLLEKSSFSQIEHFTQVTIVMHHEEERDWMINWLEYWSRESPGWIILENVLPKFIANDWSLRDESTTRMEMGESTTRVEVDESTTRMEIGDESKIISNNYVKNKSKENIQNRLKDLNIINKNNKNNNLESNDSNDDSISPGNLFIRPNISKETSKNISASSKSLLTRMSNDSPLISNGQNNLLTQLTAINQSPIESPIHSLSDKISNKFDISSTNNRNFNFDFKKTLEIEPSRIESTQEHSLFEDHSQWNEFSSWSEVILNSSIPKDFASRFNENENSFDNSLINSNNLNQERNTLNELNNSNNYNDYQNEKSNSLTNEQMNINTNHMNHINDLNDKSNSFDNDLNNINENNLNNLNDIRNFHYNTTNLTDNQQGIQNSALEILRSNLYNPSFPFSHPSQTNGSFLLTPQLIFQASMKQQQNQQIAMQSIIQDIHSNYKYQIQRLEEENKRLRTDLDNERAEVLKLRKEKDLASEEAKKYLHLHMKYLEKQNERLMQK